MYHLFIIAQTWNHNNFPSVLCFSAMSRENSWSLSHLCTAIKVGRPIRNSLYDLYGNRHCVIPITHTTLEIRNVFVLLLEHIVHEIYVAHKCDSHVIYINQFYRDRSSWYNFSDNFKKLLLTIFIYLLYNIRAGNLFVPNFYFSFLFRKNNVETLSPIKHSPVCVPDAERWARR